MWKFLKHIRSFLFVIKGGTSWQVTSMVWYASHAVQAIICSYFVQKIASTDTVFFLLSTTTVVASQ